MKGSNRLRAVVWDYDGTLANTWQRNYDVTCEIVKTVLDTDPDSLWPLQSVDAYSRAMAKWINWREFYREGLGLSEDEIDHVGPCWAPFQLKNTSDVQFFDDAEETVRALSDYPQGIVSQNAGDVIRRDLERSGFLEYFDCIIGYEDVPLRRQKPAPDGLLACIATLIGSMPGEVIFIGDHETDVQCALNAKAVLAENGSDQTVLSAVFVRDESVTHESWRAPPDFALQTTTDIVTLMSESVLDGNLAVSLPKQGGARWNS